MVRHSRVHKVLRDGLQKLTVADVNAAIKRHFSAKNISVVMITNDAAGLKQALVSDAPSSIRYDGEKPKELLEEDKVIGAMKLAIAPEKITVTKITEVFAK